MGGNNLKQDFVYTLYSREEKLKKGIEDDPVVSLVDSLLHNAISIAASDIHLEPNQNDMRVRFRIDGVLYDQDSIGIDHMLAVISRLKILSSLDIAEKRIPQDGKFRVSIASRADSFQFELGDKKTVRGELVEPYERPHNAIDLRISTFPSIYGEKMVIRILDRSLNCIDINSLGFAPENLETLSGLIKRPHGFFLVTGPTGSGKTTTLYAILSSLNDSSCNIVTMEDPVEYDLDGITQSQINTKAGFGFENGLRSMLRQDPDVLMVGEIRDKQTAQIAIEAALTGHLVLSTLHTNDSAGAITRLIDMGVEPFLINAALSGILAQRLVRKLCNSCKKAIDFDPNTCQAIKNKSLKKIFTAQGCPECMNLGYKGRTGIFELLVIKDNIRDLVLKKSSIQEIQEQAVKNGMSFLLDDGLRKVEQGEISLEELLRAVGE